DGPQSVREILLMPRWHDEPSCNKTWIGDARVFFRNCQELLRGAIAPSRPCPSLHNFLLFRLWRSFCSSTFFLRRMLVAASSPQYPASTRIRTMRSLITLLAVTSGSAVAAEPPAWPQFRGPGGSGVAADAARPPTRFGPDTNLKWKVSV